MKAIRVTSTGEVFVVYMRMGAMPLTVIFFPSGRFYLELSEPCKQLGLEEEAELIRIEGIFGPLSHIEHHDADGVTRQRYLLPAKRIQAWLSAIPPRATPETRRLRQTYRRELYDQMWNALSRVDAPGGRVKWCDFSQSDADGERFFTEEQVAADMGVPPEVVRRGAWAAGIYGKKGYGKWV